MRRFLIAVFSITVLLVGTSAMAQFGGITVPPNGDNQKSINTQYIGPVQVSISYSSPDVHGPDGTDRRGKIWGGLVPYGMSNAGFGTCGDECPWRGGANENTVFTISHDVKIQGQPLKAGSYGLHFIPDKTEWTLIFSKNHTSWGSFTYDVKEDALRVKAKPEKSEYHEWLTYDFIDRQPDKATVAMRWEDLQVPFIINVEKISDIYVDIISDELRSSPGFSWENWDAAAQYTLQSKSHLDVGLRWAQNAVSFPFIGQSNFTTLSTLSQLQEANGLNAEAKKTMDLALNHPTAGAINLHQYARSLQQQKKMEEANKIFELNAKRFPGVWPVEVGLARMYSAKGNYKEALKHAKIALTQAPDAGNRSNVENQIKQLEEGKDIN